MDWATDICDTVLGKNYDAGPVSLHVVYDLAAQVVYIPDVAPQIGMGRSQALKIVVQVWKVHQGEGLSPGFVQM